MSFDAEYTSCVLCCAMTPGESVRVIEAAGGDTKFAALIGIDSVPGFKQRVNNWKRRGIPANVILSNHDLIRRLQKQTKTAA
jgi:hypothetical protein